MPLRWSRYTALLFAVGLGIGEAVINWGNWQFAPMRIKPKKVSANPLYRRHPRSMNPYTDLKTSLIAQVEYFRYTAPWRKP